MSSQEHKRTVIDQQASARRRGASPAAGESLVVKTPAGRVTGSHLHMLQKGAGNRATGKRIGVAPERGATLQRKGDESPASPPPVQQPANGGASLGGAGAGNSVAVEFGGKHAFSTREIPLGKVHRGLVELSGSSRLNGEFEIVSDRADGPSTKQVVKAHGGVHVGDAIPRYQGEVELEFQRRAAGMLAGFTPKVTLGGEAARDGSGHIGIEGSLEGEIGGGRTVAFKPAFQIFERDDEQRPHFAELEFEVDFALPESTFRVADGTLVKVTGKVEVKFRVEPDYLALGRRIVQDAEKTREVLTKGGETIKEGATRAVGLAGETLEAVGTAAAVELAAGAAVALAPIIVNIKSLDDATEERHLLEKARAERDAAVSAFERGATGESDDSKGELARNAYLQGKKWRIEQQESDQGDGAPGLSNVDRKEIRSLPLSVRSAFVTELNRAMHDKLINRYWAMHNIQRTIPWEVIDSLFGDLMDAGPYNFGRPSPKEGK
jgi:hypothetical protein